MKHSPRLRRPPSEFSHRAHQLLNSYALAASAAGVRVLALAQPAKADIVYTPADITFITSSYRFIDVNHDGMNDFRFENAADLGLGSTTFVIAAGLHPGNEIRVDQQDRHALALPLGARIGPTDVFSHSATMANAYHGSGGGTWGRNRYLGLKFEVGGQKHYGWAELSIALNKHGTITAKIEGYAYETIPNKPIIAGKTSGPEGTSGVEQLNPASLAAPQPASLAVLALGSPGLSIWRRKESHEEHISSRAV